MALTRIKWCYMFRQSLLFALALLGIACASPASAEIRVFACEPEWAALAREIGGKHVKAFSATNRMQDPHPIRARPSLIASMRRADLLFCSGAGLEVGWLPILLKKGAAANLQPGQPGHLLAADYVPVLEKPHVVDRALGDIHPEGNPHVHLDARNLALLACELSRRLSTIDPPNAQEYAQQSRAFIERWSHNIARWKKMASDLEGMPVIVHHKTWSYLVRWLGLKTVGALEPLPGIQPTPRHLEALLKTSRRQPVKAILRTPYDPPMASDWLSSKTGVPVLTLPYTVQRDAQTGSLKGLFDETIAPLIAANQLNI